MSSVEIEKDLTEKTPESNKSAQKISLSLFGEPLVKRDEELPTKSSTEILTELFGAFNSEPPKSPDFPLSNCSTADESESEGKKGKESKKIKKKHKHKKKKSKKKKSKKHKRSESSETDKEGDNPSKKRKTEGEKPKKELTQAEKKSIVTLIDPVVVKINTSEKSVKRVVEISSVPESDENDKCVSNEQLSTVLEQVEEDDNSSDRIIDLISIESENADAKDENGKSEYSCNEESSKGDKSKPGKIFIKNLKFSSIFEATVREVEEQARLKAEKFEEGEVSSDSSESESKHSSVESQESDISSDESAKSKSSRKSDKSAGKSSSERHRRRRHHRSKSNKHRKSKTEEDKKKDKKHRKNQHKKSRSRSRSKSKESSKAKHSKKSDNSDEDSTRKSNTNRDYKGKKRRSKSVERSKSVDKERRSSSRERRNYRRRRSRSRSRSRSRNRHYDRHSRRSRSRDRKRRSSRSHSKEKIDKQKLLEIARKNAMNLLKQGNIPPTAGVTVEKVASIKAGGKSVAELTDFCKQLSKKEAQNQESSDSEKEGGKSDSDTERPFHHPFQIRGRPSNIVMNIRNSVPLPVKTLQEKAAEQNKILRLQFPVSSGQQHRKTEREWVPVSPKKEDVLQVMTILPVDEAQIPLPSQPPPDVRVFPDAAKAKNLDIGSIVSQRLTAMRKLQENPYDLDAKTEMDKAQEDMRVWAESKQQPGQFTGSTGVRVLSAAELSAGYQAWAKKNVLKLKQAIEARAHVKLSHLRICFRLVAKIQQTRVSESSEELFSHIELWRIS